jgi:iron-sulfur cluster assembly protein
LIQLTERAVKEIRRIVSEQHLPEGTALRVGVKGGGCSGFSYTLGFDDQIGEIDQVNEVEGVKVVCDPKSFLYLNGTQIDFEDTLMGRGFKFGNPHASKT